MVSSNAVSSNAVQNFDVLISNAAEPIYYDAVTDFERDILCRGIAYDANEHDVYRFFVTVKPAGRKYKTKRERTKRSYAKVKQALVSLKPSTKYIKLLGMYPSNTTIDGQQGFDLKGEVIINVVNGVYLEMKGEGKNLARRTKKFEVIAGRTDELAQWIFLKPYIDRNINFEMQVLCVVPKSIPGELRYLSCKASFNQDRYVLESSARRIAIP
jgi:hypothetical protein